MPIKWPKKFETDEAKNMNYFCISGRLQIEYDMACKKNGVSPHKDLKYIIEQRLVILKNKDRQLEEIDKQMMALQRRKELIENESTLIMTNEKLVAIVDEKLQQIVKGTTYQFIYGVIKYQSHRHGLTFNEMLEVFCKEAQDKIENPVYKNRVLSQLKFVGDHANNGLLTDEQINEVFPRLAVTA